jgi:hypothetical protein
MRPMTDISSLRRRALGAVCLAAIVVAPAACGGGDDDDAAPAATTTTAAAAPASCAERFVELANREDVIDAARTDADALPADAEGAFEALDADCGDELDALPEAEFEALVSQIDPDVAEYLGESGSQEFEKTGDSIPSIGG